MKSPRRSDQAKKLCLGSAQWGLPYGIANKTGQPDLTAVGEILRLASNAGIESIDTAHAYGEAEFVTGHFADSFPGFSIYTKTIPLRLPEISHDDVSRVRDAFSQSLERLRRNKVQALLVHHGSDLLAHGGDILWNLLEDLRKEGQVAQIGVSVYAPDELREIAKRYPLQIVQIPASIYDQRFLRGILTPLRASGCEIHARSAFLQGLLLQDPAEFQPHFASIRDHHEKLLSYVRSAGHSAASAAIHFVLNQACLDRVVLGFEQANQLKEILSLLENNKDRPLFLESFAIEREEIVNPSLWPKQ
jgi:aryl-alcohol dehydrogenase-like predicted oxidoreductase